MITIVSIALVAIAAIMGIYYGGIAFQNSQYNVAANAIINEAQQILAASRMWATYNNQPDVSSSSEMSALYNGKELAEWPYVSALVSGPMPSGGSYNLTTSTFSQGNYNINGYSGIYNRALVTYNSQNYILYSFMTSTNYGAAPAWTSSSTYANHPITLIAIAINAALQKIPSTSSPSIIGVPEAYTVSWTSVGTILGYGASARAPNAFLYLDATGHSKSIQGGYHVLDKLGVTIGFTFIAKVKNQPQ